MKIRRSLADLKKLFESDASSRATLAMKLIAEAQFMESVLKALKKNIKNSDVVSVFEQGTQRFDRENQALRSYNTTLKNYQSIIKQLNDMLPNKEVIKSDGEFDL